MNAPIKFNILKHAGEPTPFSKGSVIFKKGDAGESMYLVSSGKVDIVADGNVVETLTDGDIFGEMALIDHQVRSADAVANTDCGVICIDERRFLFMTENTPQFALQMMRLVAARLRDRMADLEQMQSS
ncbi:cyclic nucleotide-binding domain protein [Verrucomicrobiia bacterium DG1235]|nr:cyclic nucleotide-binding domain protein [Verrucomicrobiae bacterium DG1235]